MDFVGDGNVFQWSLPMDGTRSNGARFPNQVSSQTISLSSQTNQIRTPHFNQTNNPQMHPNN
eukprot:1326606-Amorphochlora_amoeboformis.AAC.1